MKFKTFLFIMLLATVFVWVSWFFIIFSLDPTKTTFIGFSFFYLALSASLLGTFFLAGIILRRIFQKDFLISKQVIRSFRQAFLFTLLVLSALVLQHKQFLYWWTILLLILIFGVLELLFLSLQRSPS